MSCRVVCSWPSCPNVMLGVRGRCPGGYKCSVKCRRVSNPHVAHTVAGPQVAAKANWLCDPENRNPLAKHDENLKKNKNDNGASMRCG